MPSKLDLNFLRLIMEMVGIGWVRTRSRPPRRRPRKSEDEENDEISNPDEAVRIV